MPDSRAPVRGPEDPGTREPPRRRRYLAGYADLLAIPRAHHMALASLLSKLPISMVAISVLLLVSPHYSYGMAGVAVSSMLVAGALTAPYRGRLVDRYSARGMLLFFLGAYLAALTGLAWSASERVPVGVVLACAALIGASLPPVNMLMRTLWKAVTTEHTLTSAISLESVTMDLALIAGPALATWLSLSVSPVLPFVVCGVFVTGAVGLILGLVGDRGAPAADDRPRDWLGPLRSAPLRRIFLAQFLFCLALTAIEVTLPLYARQHHAVGYTGVYLGAIAVGSIVGGLAVGAAPRMLPRARRLPLLLVSYAVGTALLALAASVSPLMVLLACPVAGLAIGSTFAAIMMTGGDLAPKGFDNETQGWTSSLTQVGSAAGAAAGSGAAVATSSLTVLSAVPAVVLLAVLMAWNTSPVPEPSAP
ncbi:MFS transporter [Streptomyces iconiensis]|uniref:MFS transporter n=1 Tax=Streptomyces iconiensis TaxID=1384038 RepID=A0ABT7A144_9ACTN|nr:MFS transporter [Streptomyces iconiensis]MDJ1134784.1 MFS transporter [Streptomyces iconiensis]